MSLHICESWTFQLSSVHLKPTSSRFSKKNKPDFLDLAGCPRNRPETVIPGNNRKSTIAASKNKLVHPQSPISRPPLLRSFAHKVWPTRPQSFIGLIFDVESSTFDVKSSQVLKFAWRTPEAVTPTFSERPRGMGRETDGSNPMGKPPVKCATCFCVHMCI